MKDDIGDRMKSYEAVTQSKLMPRTPIIMRLDGRAFHTFTKMFDPVHDPVFKEAMIEAQKTLMENVQGAEIGYTQSDEISLFIKNYNKFNSETWHGGKIQKMVSSAASIATGAFIKRLALTNNSWTGKSWGFDADKLFAASFDCRVFNIPIEEVANYFVWRGKDCSRNAISSYYRHKFGHSAMMNKKTGDMLNEIPEQEWQEVDSLFKFGYLFIKQGSGALISTDFIKNSVDMINKVVDTREEE